MTLMQKRYRSRCAWLADGHQTMEGIYRQLFFPSDYFSPQETVMTEEGAYVGARRYRTYAQIYDQIEHSGKAIYALTGLKGAFIGLYAENSPQWIVLFWAILRSGNYPFLINLRQPEEMARDILRTLDAKIVVCVDGAPDLAERTICYAQLQETDTTQVLCPEFGDQIALATSGTTLKQKICIYTGKEIVAQLANVESIVKKNKSMIACYRSNIRQLVFLPFYHIFGLEAVLLWFSFLGATFVFPANMTPKTLLRTIRDHGVTHIFAVPLFWDAVHKGALREMQETNSLERFQKGAKLSLALQKLPMGTAVAKRLVREVREQLFGDSVRFCISGGSHISRKTLEFFNALGYPLYNGFGMSEIGISSVELSKKARERIRGSVGQPFDSVEYRIDRQGHLLVRGDSVCQKILIDGVLQPTGDWLDTGDLVTEDHGYYFVNGRVSDLVFDADGENLNPELAERALQLKNAVQFSVVGDEKNEKLILVVQLDANLSQEQKQALRREIEETNRSLPTSYQLKKIYFTYDPLKSEKAIKVSRAWLRKAIADGRVKLHEHMDRPAARESQKDSPIKAILRQKMAALLQIAPEDIPDTAHFMNDLGGSSLDFFSLVSDMEREFGITMDYEPENFRCCLEDFERIVEESKR